MGCDEATTLKTLIYRRFQSTHPSWGATPIGDVQHWQRAEDFNPRTHRGVRLNNIVVISCIGYFNPRTHRGVRLCIYDEDSKKMDISIHAPIVGCDYSIFLLREADSIFQSTHPSWGATVN